MTMRILLTAAEKAGYALATSPLQPARSSWSYATGDDGEVRLGPLTPGADLVSAPGQ